MSNERQVSIHRFSALPGENGTVRVIYELAESWLKGLRMDQGRGSAGDSDDDAIPKVAEAMGGTDVCWRIATISGLVEWAFIHVLRYTNRPKLM